MSVSKDSIVYQGFISSACCILMIAMFAFIAGQSIGLSEKYVWDTKTLFATVEHLITTMFG